MLQQMLPQAPKSPSRKTHSPAPSLPSVPEEGAEGGHFETQRSFSQNSTISRPSVAPPRLNLRRLPPIPTSPVQVKPNEDEPVSPIPTALVPGRLVTMFNNPNNTATTTITSTTATVIADNINNSNNNSNNNNNNTNRVHDLGESDRNEGSSSAVSMDRERTKSAPTLLPTKVPATTQFESGQLMQPIKATPQKLKPIQTHKVSRKGIIPRYGSRNLRFSRDDQPGATIPHIHPHERPSSSFTERTKENEMQASLNRRVLRHQQLLERPRNHIWAYISLAITCCFPARVFPRAWTKNRRQDWREKVSFGILAAILSLVVSLLLLGLPIMTCTPYSVQSISMSTFNLRYGNASTGVDSSGLMAIRGSVYDVGGIFADGRHPSVTGNNLDQSTLNSFLSAHYGTDVSSLFLPSNPAASCNLFGASNNFGKCLPDGTGVDHCHQIQLSQPLLNEISRKDIMIRFQWTDIQHLVLQGRGVFIYDGSVFDATDYLSQPSNMSMSQPEEAMMDWVRSLVVILVVLVVITAMRLISALIYHLIFSDSRPESDKKTSDPNSSTGSCSNSNVLMLVTCQASDSEDAIKATLDALILTDYDDNRKMLMVITDTTVDGLGDPTQAMKSCLKLMDHPPTDQSEKRKDIADDVDLESQNDPISIGRIQRTSDTSIVDGTRVYSGYYFVGSRRVPYILVSRPPQTATHLPNSVWQKKKMIIRWLYRISINKRISALEFALSERVRELNHQGPGLYDLLLMSEIGSVCDQKSIGRMVDTLERKKRLLGVSGQCVINNRSQNWVTRVQDYENHLSQQFTFPFESTFGVVQCLPNQFSMVKIKIKQSVEGQVPNKMVARRQSLDASIISSSDEGVDDNHQFDQEMKPGTDEGLNNNTVGSVTVTPNYWTYIGEQRRILINSIHSNWVYMWSPELRGIFCCSINFLAFLRWIRLILSPTLIALAWAAFIVVIVAVATNTGGLHPFLSMSGLICYLAVMILRPFVGILLGRRGFVLNITDSDSSEYSILGNRKTEEESFANELSDELSTEPRKETNLDDSMTLRYWGEWIALFPINPMGAIQQEPKQEQQNPRQKWAEVFENPNLSLELLKSQAVLPNSNLGIDGIRSVCWKVYLSCLPTLELSTWPFAMAKEREKYMELRKKYIKAVGSDDGPDPDLEVNNPLSLAEDSPWQQFFVDSELRKIIKQDVERTLPDNDYFRSEKIQDQLNDILFIYCKINQDVSYRQGMHELVAHILWVVSSESLDVGAEPEITSTTGECRDSTLEAMKSVLDSNYIEHDAFALFSSLMSRAKPWYEFSDEGGASRRNRPTTNNHTQPFGKSESPEPTGKQTPVIEWSMKIFHYLERVDNELYLHLKELEIQPQLFGM
ncbi:TBC1 domain, member 5 [Entomortierella beljakovae]|nr:TBC1 domain, member 5 [Entomortierella beljakovae]